MVSGLRPNLSLCDAWRDGQKTKGEDGWRCICVVILFSRLALCVGSLPFRERTLQPQRNPQDGCFGPKYLEIAFSGPKTLETRTKYRLFVNGLAGWQNSNRGEVLQKKHATPLGVSRSGCKIDNPPPPRLCIQLAWHRTRTGGRTAQETTPTLGAKTGVVD